MTLFDTIAREESTLAPVATQVVPPEAFSMRWLRRPKDATCCGLRPLSESDIRFAMVEAERLVKRCVEQGARDESVLTGVYNDALICLAVARGTCDPNNATRSWDVWGGAPEDTVQDALTKEGAKALYDAIERVTIATSPVRPEIRDAEFDELFAIARESLARLPPPRAQRCRRLFYFLLTELRADE